MCGRFTNKTGFNELQTRFHVDNSLQLMKPRYNIAPGQEVAVVVHEEGARNIKMMQWGLIPSWANDPAIGNKMINARQRGQIFC